MAKIEKIIDKFNFKGDFVNLIENCQGNINSTYILIFNNDGFIRKYMLQKINTSVFKEPLVVMRNIELVIDHLRKKNDAQYKVLNIVKTKDEKNIYVYFNENNEKEYYRAYDFVDGCISYDSLNESDDPIGLAYSVGKCFGAFHKSLNDFPVELLTDSIPDFHNTSKRFDDLILSIENNVTNRAYKCSKEIVDLITRIKECSIIWNKLQKDIPLRVTHNDAKLNNVLFDSKSNQAVCVIDLDTVMAGSILFDFGDGIRSTCSNSFEDITDLNSIFINLDYVKSYIKGYLEEMLSYLTYNEKKYLGLSIKILTYELCLRFLTDYINGDVYFKTKYEEHNYDRFMNQYKLMLDIESKMDEINSYIDSFK